MYMVIHIPSSVDFQTELFCFSIKNTIKDFFNSWCKNGLPIQG